MQVLKKRFGRKTNKEMLAECIWSAKRDTTFYKSSKPVFVNNIPSCKRLNTLLKELKLIFKQ